jgi:hypothetical protein
VIRGLQLTGRAHRRVGPPDIGSYLLKLAQVNPLHPPR